MTEECPGCPGLRVPDDPLRLSSYDHEDGCPVAREEAETLALDLGRHRRRARRGAATAGPFYRSATAAERALLHGSGVGRPPTAPTFARLDWTVHEDGAVTRLRMWTGTYVHDEVTVR